MSKIKKVASYTVFCNDHKNRLTTAYPFLALDQINYKLREKWNGLSVSEKKCYSKAVLCQPAARNSSSSSSYKTKQKRNKRAKVKTSTKRKTVQDDINLFEEDPFEHSEEIELDSSTIFGPDETYLSSSPSYFQRSNSKTYMGARIPVDHSVPAVVDETPFVKQGILKKRCSEKDRKARVQFVSPLVPLRDATNLELDLVNKPKRNSKNYENTLDMSVNEKKETCLKLPGSDGDGRSPPPPNIVESKRRSKRLVNQKGAADTFNYANDWSSSQSEEAKPKTDLTIAATDDEDKSPGKRSIKPLTPELQRSMSQLIIQKVCRAPKKKGSRGNSAFTKTIDCENGANDTSTPKSIGMKGKKIKGINPHQLILTDKSDSSEEILKRNANLPVKTNNGSGHVMSSKFKCLFSPDESLSSNDFADNDLEWDLWNNSQEERDCSKYCDSTEKSVSKMKKMMSPCLMSSMVSNSPDSMVTECSSPLSGISELSDPDSDSYEEPVEEETEKMDSKTVLYINEKISAGGDAKGHSVYKHNPEYPFESMFEEVSHEKRKSSNSRILTASKMEHNPTSVFQDDSLFC
ncbi:uncharacterized protein LOC115218667 [Argonauta hians]